MRTLIEQAEAAAAKSQAAADAKAQDARATYTRLLLRNSKPHAGDRQDLARCMETLGKSAEDVAEDVALIGLHRSVLARALRVGELLEARGAALTLARATEERCTTETKNLEDAATKAKAEENAASHRWLRAKDAQQALPMSREKLAARDLDVAALEPGAVDPQTPSDERSNSDE